ncbi:hypothetical protein BT69DRAFT_1279573 [Atractiella rhizophila]|nr:hypothetical protein BT69DRAFT_1279573 [Atractiella rhizophila]
MGRLNLSDLEDGDIERDDLRRQAAEAERPDSSDSDLDLDAQLHKIRFGGNASSNPTPTPTASTSDSAGASAASASASQVDAPTDMQKRPGPGKWLEGNKMRPSRPLKRPKGVIPPRMETEEERREGEEGEVEKFRSDMKAAAEAGRLKSSNMAMDVVSEGVGRSVNAGIDDFVPEEESDDDATKEG